MERTIHVLLIATLALLAFSPLTAAAQAPSWADHGKYVVYRETITYSYSGGNMKYSMTIYGDVKYTILGYNTTHVTVERRVLDTNDTTGQFYHKGETSVKTARWDDPIIVVEDYNVSIKLYIPPETLQQTHPDGHIHQESSSQEDGSTTNVVTDLYYDTETGLLTNYTVTVTTTSSDSNTTTVLRGEMIETNIEAGGTGAPPIQEGEQETGEENQTTSGGTSGGTGSSTTGNQTTGGSSSGTTGSAAGKTGGETSGESGSEESGGGGGGNTMLIAGVAIAVVAVGAALAYFFIKK